MAAMVEAIDDWRSAKRMVEKHGPDALNYARIRADLLSITGDTKGRAQWMRIIRAIEKLQRARLRAYASLG